MRTRFVLAFCALVVPAASYAQRTTDAPAYPARPVRILIGFTPGGQPDIATRVVAPRLAEALGQPFVVDNRPGAGGTIAARLLAEAMPDGQTLLSVSAAHVIAPVTYARLPYHVLKDFAGITTITNATYLVSVTNTLGAKNAQELIALAKAKPGWLNYASAGTGSATHFAAEMFKFRAGIDAVHVPYKGIPEALTDTISGRVQLFMAPIGSSYSLVKEGKLRALGITSKERSRLYPDLPTIAEQGLPGYQWDSWNVMLAPARTPRAIVERLSREVGRALAQPEVEQRLTAVGLEPAPRTPAETDRMLAEQLAIVTDLAGKAGIKPQ